MYRNYERTCLGNISILYTNINLRRHMSEKPLPITSSLPPTYPLPSPLLVLFLSTLPPPPRCRWCGLRCCTGDTRRSKSRESTWEGREGRVRDVVGVGKQNHNKYYFAFSINPLEPSGRHSSSCFKQCYSYEMTSQVGSNELG